MRLYWILLGSTGLWWGSNIMIQTLYISTDDQVDTYDTCKTVA